MTLIIFFHDRSPAVHDSVDVIEHDEHELRLCYRDGTLIASWHPSNVVKIEVMNL